MSESPKNLYLGIGGFLDEESRSTCPLLTPSPTAVHFKHPLESPGSERQQSPSSGDTEISTLPPHCAANNSQTTPGCLIQNGLEGSSSSSSSSVLQDSAASAQLLNYLNLPPDPSQTEKGVINGLNLLNLSKSAQDYKFVSWNWMLIRRWCFWGVMSLSVACVCVIIGYITTIPRRCDPPRAWYQGTLIYQIFPPSFQDTDSNGIGDFKGITNRINYIEHLGAKGVRLSYIFPSQHYPEHFKNSDNLTQIDHNLGSFKDFEVLIERLHQRNISIILDLPLYPFFERLKMKSEEEDHEVKHVIVNNHILVSTHNKTHTWGSERSEITDILLFWLNIGVDGFYLQGLEHFVNDKLFTSQILEWRTVLNKYNQGFEKILICSEEVVSSLQEVTADDAQSKMNIVMKSFDLINVMINPFHNGTTSIRDKLNAIQTGIIYSKPGYPWIYWTCGDMNIQRLASRAPFGNITMAVLITTILLPGTPGIFYGDEIGLTDVNDYQMEDVRHSHHLPPMHWSETRRGHGFSERRILPWLPISSAKLSLAAPALLSRLSELRDSNPGLYMNAMWKNNILLPNTAIRYADKNVILIERNYPRRNTYLLVANLGNEIITKDFSSHYYGGNVVLDTTEKEGRYITFQKTKLSPGQAFLTKLDK